MYTVAYVIYTILEILRYLIFIRVILSYVPMRSNGFTDFIVKVTEPCLGPIRMLLERFTSGNMMMLDFSPFVALILISILQSLL